MTAPDFEPVPEGMDPNSPEYMDWVKDQFRKMGWTEMPGDQARMLIAEAE